MHAASQCRVTNIFISITLHMLFCVNVITRRKCNKICNQEYQHLVQMLTAKPLGNFTRQTGPGSSHCAL